MLDYKNSIGSNWIIGLVKLSMLKFVQVICDEDLGLGFLVNFLI